MRHVKITLKYGDHIVDVAPGFSFADKFGIKTENLSCVEFSPPILFKNELLKHLHFMELFRSENKLSFMPQKNVDFIPLDGIENLNINIVTPGNYICCIPSNLLLSLKFLFLSCLF
jgi:hypothetical protein